MTFRLLSSIKSDLVFSIVSTLGRFAVLGHLTQRKLLPLSFSFEVLDPSVLVFDSKILQNSKNFFLKY